MDLSKYGIEVDFSRPTWGGESTDMVEMGATVFISGKVAFTTPWKVGVGHLPGYKCGGKDSWYSPRGGGMTLWGQKQAYRAVHSYKAVPEDVIYHIIAFSYILEMTFPEWAENLGMPEDSIKAKKDYEDRRHQCLVLRRVIGEDWDDIVEEARER